MLLISSPTVVSGPCPESRRVSPGRVYTWALILISSCSQLLPGKSVRPTEPAKIKSPQDGQTYTSVRSCTLAQVTAPAQTYMLAESSWRHDKQMNTDGVIYAIYPPEMPKDWTWAHPYGCHSS